MGVVDGLEAVEVDDDENAWLIMAPGLGQMPLQGALEPTAVEGAGEFVGALGEPFQADNPSLLLGHPPLGLPQGGFESRLRRFPVRRLKIARRRRVDPVHPFGQLQNQASQAAIVGGVENDLLACGFLRGRFHSSGILTRIGVVRASAAGTLPWLFPRESSCQVPDCLESMAYGAEAGRSGLPLGNFCRASGE